MSEATTNVVVCLAQDDPVVFAAGRALVAAWERRGTAVRLLDLREGFGPAPLRRVASFLGRVSERTLSGALARLGGSRFAVELQEHAPQVAVALDPVAAQVLLEWRRAGRFAAPVVGVDAALEPTAWADVEVDSLVVADEVAAEQARAGGRPESRIAAVGVPVAPEVAAAAGEDRAALRVRFGLPEDRPVVLVDARRLESFSLTSLLLQLGLVAARVHLVFDAGGDADGAAALRKQAAVHGLRARMFGDVPEGPLYWRAADLCVVAPEAEPMTRCAALGVPPLVLASPDEADPIALARAVEGRGGFFSSSIARLGATLELAIREERLGRARAQAAAHARPEAADEVAALALRLAAERPAGATASAPADEHRAAGALEEIGAGADEARAQTPQQAVARLAALGVATERTQRRLAESRKELERWERRLALAHDRGEATLEQAARAETDSYRRAVTATQAELARLAEERQELEAVAAGKASAASRAVPRAADLEAEFRKLEIDEELQALKARDGKERKDR